MATVQIALEAESTLTDRFQTTLPSPVRQALHLGKRDKIKYAIRSDGSVIISRATAESESDPVLGEFLSFIASDMQAHPERLQPLTASMRESVEALVSGVLVDLDAPLMDEDE